MKNAGSTIISLIVVAAIVGGGTYYVVNTKISAQKNDFSNQVGDLKSKLSSLEANTNKVANDLKSQQNSSGSTATSDTAASTGSTAAAPTPTQASTATPSSATPPKTTDWKSFSSSRYAYTVKYPKDWTYKDITGGSSMNATGFYPQTAKETFPFSVVIEKSNLDYSIAQIKKAYAQDYSYKDKSTAEVNSTAFTVLNFSGKTSAATAPQVYLATKDDLVYHFAINNSNDANVNAILSEIAKTFQFSK